MRQLWARIILLCFILLLANNETCFILLEAPYKLLCRHLPVCYDMSGKHHSPYKNAEGSWGRERTGIGARGVVYVHVKSNVRPGLKGQ